MGAHWARLIHAAPRLVAQRLRVRIGTPLPPPPSRFGAEVPQAALQMLLMLFFKKKWCSNSTSYDIVLIILYVDKRFVLLQAAHVLALVHVCPPAPSSLAKEFCATKHSGKLFTSTVHRTSSGNALAQRR